MIDKERVAKILSDLDRYLEELKKLEIRDVADLRDSKTFFAASMLAFSILNRTIDLGDEVVSGKNFGIPSRYKEIFFLLYQNRIIDRKLRDKIYDVIKYRNVLAHEYGDVTAKDVLHIVKNVRAVEDFIKKVKKHL